MTVEVITLGVSVLMAALCPGPLSHEMATTVWRLLFEPARKRQRPEKDGTLSVAGQGWPCSGAGPSELPFLMWPPRAAIAHPLLTKFSLFGVSLGV